MYLKRKDIPTILLAVLAVAVVISPTVICGDEGSVSSADLHSHPHIMKHR